MKTGIELIAIERQEQIEKHGRTIERDIIDNPHNELREGAIVMLSNWPMSIDLPESWQGGIMENAIRKPTKERLIIAGALIAAEIDRIQK